MNKVYLLLGSNVGDSASHLSKAKKAIGRQIGNVMRESAIYRTAAWGKTDQPDFLNQVLVVETKLDSHQLLQTILQTEQKMGRIRTEKNAPRVIDIDILFFNKAIIETPELIVPHPHIAIRRFVLTPLNELAPNFVHPVLQKTIHQLLRVCPDKLAVKKN